MHLYFNPLSLYRERRASIPSFSGYKHISIHSPYTGRDQCEHSIRAVEYISIHSPYTGRDLRFQPFAACLNISIHSPYTGRDGQIRVNYCIHYLISIHSPYTGRDSSAVIVSFSLLIFQSTLPIQGETRP